MPKLLQLLDELVSIWQGKEPYTMAAKAVLTEKGFSLKWLEERRQDCQEALSKVAFGGVIAKSADEVDSQRLK